MKMGNKKDLAKYYLHIQAGVEFSMVPQLIVADDQDASKEEFCQNKWVDKCPQLPYPPKTLEALREEGIFTFVVLVPLTREGKHFRLWPTIKFKAIPAAASKQTKAATPEKDTPGTDAGKGASKRTEAATPEKVTGKQKPATTPGKDTGNASGGTVAQTRAMLFIFLQAVDASCLRLPSPPLGSEPPTMETL